MKKVCLDLSECNGLGDLICATPIIRKLSHTYQSGITILSKMPELFKNNPYVLASFKNTSVDLDYFRDNYLMHNSFYNVGKKNERGIEYRHNMIDIRQFHAINLGFQLRDDEMECFYEPTEKRSDELPSGKYIVIHPVQNWATRSWPESEWKKLIYAINNSEYTKDIQIVAIGKNSSEKGFFNVNKPTYELDGLDFVNLMNKISIGQSWYLLNDAVCVITMDSGILHLAGTTETSIVHLGSSIHPFFRKPYRRGLESKYHYVGGTCDIFCGSDMKYGVKEWGDIQGVPPLLKCLENKETFECHPPSEKVMNVLTSIVTDIL